LTLHQPSRHAHQARTIASTSPRAASNVLDLVGFGRGLTSVVAGWNDDPWLAGARLLLVPGRYLVGPAGA
jgi:hypothetical protein